MQAAQIDIPDFADGLRRDIDTNRIRLPTLPDVALRVQAAVEEATSAQGIAALLAQDIALSSRILQVANSALYRGATQIDTLQAAVTRLGTKMVKSFVIGLAMRQLFKSSSETLSRHFRQVWEDAIQVAAISRTLAGDTPGIDPDEALLAGLLHNIGALPVLARLDQLDVAAIDGRTVQGLVDEVAPEIGTRMLQAWHLPASLSAVPEGCLALERDPGPTIDYVDIVLVARLQYLFSAGLIDMTARMCGLPALRKLHINFEVIELQDEQTAAWATQMRDVLAP